MKHYFAPIPNRALIDDRVTGRKLKILGIISAHDRMGRNGQHCTLSVRRIGEKLGVDFSNARKDIRDLIEWGYIGRLAHPTHKQRWQLAIAYDDAADLAVVKGNRGYEQPQSDAETVVTDDPTEDSNLKVYKRYAPQGASSSLRDDAAMCDPDPFWDEAADVEDDQTVGVAGEDEPPTPEQMDAFAADLLKEPNDAIFLRKIENAWWMGDRYHPEIAELIYQRLSEIHEAGEIGDSLGGWAYRMLQDFEFEQAGFA